MRLSCIPICFFEEIRSGRMALSAWIGTAASLGLDGIELYCGFLKTTHPGTLEKLADEIDGAGLEVSMYTSYGELADPS